MTDNPRLNIQSVDVLLRGIRPLMFDRYAGNNTTKLPNQEKMYFLGSNGAIGIPDLNVFAMLGAKNYMSAAKLVFGKQYQRFADAAIGFVEIEPQMVPVLRDPAGEPVHFTRFGEDGFYLDVSTARVKKGSAVVPNPIERPVLDLPWFLAFTLRLMPNNEGLDMVGLKRLFEAGGLGIGLGTWRGRYGKFVIESWK